MLPYLNETLGLEDGGEVLDAIKLATALHWREAGGLAVGIVRTFTHSGAAMAAWIANLLLIPVVTFYLLRDWDQLVVRVHALVPETYKTRVAQVTKDCDEVIAEFFRGQILVMAGLSLIYAVGLGLVGLELALLIGLVAGVVNFVPYLGLFVGIALAGAAYLQFRIGTGRLRRGRVYRCAGDRRDVAHSTAGWRPDRSPPRRRYLCCAGGWSTVRFYRHLAGPPRRGGVGGFDALRTRALHRE